MNSQEQTRRLVLIERLGEFIPSLEGRVYPADLVGIKVAYKMLSREPNDELSLVRHYTTNLRCILRTAELYTLNTESRTLLSTAIEMLEDILGS